MGLWYQCIVDRDTDSEADAREHAARVVAWLAGRGIIEPDLSACLLGEEQGYAPGPKAYTAFAAKSDGTALQDNDGLDHMQVNGLEVIIGREVSFNMQGEFEAALCPECGHRRAQDGEWSDAMSGWAEGTGDGLLLCPACDKATTVAEWEHIDPMGFGTLTFKFWDWPVLSDDFVNDLAAELDRRIAFISGKL